MTLGQGFHHGIPFADYIADKLHAEPTLSHGVACELTRASPLHARHAHPRLNPHWRPKNHAIMDAGSVAHEILLGGESRIVPIDPEQFVGKKGGVPKGWTNDAIRAARDTAWAEGKIPVLLDDLAQTHEMVTVAREYISRSEVAELFTETGGASEVTMLWQQGGVWCRARADRMSTDRSIVLDYKSTAASAEPSAWARNHLVPDGYDLQESLYRAGNKALTGKTGTFLFLVQENEPPFACSLVGCDPALQQFSDDKLHHAIGMWAACRAKDRWPGYPSRVAWAEPSAFAVAQFDERKTLEELFELGGQA